MALPDTRCQHDCGVTVFDGSSDELTKEFRMPLRSRRDTIAFVGILSAKEIKESLNVD